MKYTQEYRIYENDVDFRKMATLGTLLRYCQQIGTEDAERYGITPELYASTHTSYVLAKLALHITRTPARGRNHYRADRAGSPAPRRQPSLYHLLRCTGQGRGVCGQPLGVD